MPNYEFHCDNCDKDRTITCKMSEYKSDEPCEVCGEPMHRKTEDYCLEYVAHCAGFYGKHS